VAAKRSLSAALGGADFRQAVAALASLRHLDPAEARARIPEVYAQDEQRAFQIRVARLIADGGIGAVAAAWQELPSAKWRKSLVEAIDRAWLDWDDEGSIDLVIAALEDDISVARIALGSVRWWVAPPTARERKDASKTKAARAYMEARDRADSWFTRARRARVTRSLVNILRGYPANRPSLFWPDKFIDVLGHTATREDTEALGLLEGFRQMAGEVHRYEATAHDPSNLPWPTSLLAQRTGIPPGTPMKRVTAIPTGLLDLANLEAAIARIRARASSGQPPANPDR